MPLHITRCTLYNILRVGTAAECSPESCILQLHAIVHYDIIFHLRMRHILSNQVGYILLRGGIIQSDAVILPR